MRSSSWEAGSSFALFASRHSLVSSPVTAVLRTDWRYCLRSCLAFFRALMPASIWEKSSSILATMRFCCSCGATGTGNALNKPKGANF